MSWRNSSVSRSASSAQSTCTRVGPLQQRVVDVGDVLDVGDLVAGVAPGAVEQVERDVGGRVAEVGGVVRGDAADVEPRRPVGAGGTSPPVAVSWTRHRRARSRAGRDLRGGPGTHGRKPSGGAVRRVATGWPAIAPRLREPAAVGQPAQHRRCSASISRSVSSSASARPASPSTAARDLGHHRDLLVGERLPRPAPQHGPQLVLGVEGDAVVDAVAVPVGIASTCPPLRSALLTIASNTAIRRSGSVSAWTSETGWSCPSTPSNTAATRRAPRPRAPGHGRPAPGRAPAKLHHARRRAARRGGRSAGRCPSRSPRRRAYAATSRPARVPSGKSHSGRSPATGL